MKIVLIGYGKMGKAIEKIAIQRGHEIVYKSNSSASIDDFDMSNCDVAIEFTRPDLAISHINHCLNHNTPIVVGTTAWLDKLTDIENKVSQANGSLLYASNFSVGVNIFFELNKKLASLMSNHKDYSTQLDEIHHLEKLDAPSGTAIHLANDLIENHQEYKSWILGEGEKPQNNINEIPITSFREPGVPGTHSVQYVSDIDSISIKHEAHNREGFALGAVLAAEWLPNKKGVFTMSNVLNIN